MRVTTKGQVTIPQDIRDKMNIYPGAEVDFIIEGNTVKIIQTKKALQPGKSIVERLRGKASVGMTTDEIMALTRG